MDEKYHFTNKACTREGIPSNNRILITVAYLLVNNVYIGSFVK